MEIVIWGAGIRGKRLFDKLPEGLIVAYIDTDTDLHDMCYNEIPIISYETYKSTYQEYPILVSALYNDSIITQLHEDNNFNYWVLNEEPKELQDLEKKCINTIFNEIPFQDQRYLIFGSTYFSILLYDYLKTHEFDVALGLEKRSIHINGFLKKHLPHATEFANIDVNDYTSLLICSWFFADNTFNIIGQLALIDMMDNVLLRKKTYYEKLQKFKNIHKNDRCFIVANGPSLKMEDLDLLQRHNECTFGVNGIYLSADKTSWRPNYYIIADINFADIEYECYKNYSSDNLFIPDLSKKTWNRVLPSHFYKYSWISRTNDKPMYVSDDICQTVYASMTVMHICLQFAMYMGVKEIYLIGADTTNYHDTPQSHFTDNYNSSEFMQVTKETFLDIDKITKGYRIIKGYADNNGIKIFNATRGGALEVFERVDFDTLF